MEVWLRRRSSAGNSIEEEAARPGGPPEEQASGFSLAISRSRLRPGSWKRLSLHISLNLEDWNRMMTAHTHTYGAPVSRRTILTTIAAGSLLAAVPPEAIAAEAKRITQADVRTRSGFVVAKDGTR